MNLLLVICIVILTKNAQAISENDIPELDYLDTSADPCENFYQYTCGNFKSIHPRTGNLGIMDHFYLLSQHLIKAGRELLAANITEDDPIAVRKAKTAYKACMSDWFSHLDEPPEFEIIRRYNGFPLIENSDTQIEFSWDEIGDLVGNYGVPLLFNYQAVQMNGDYYLYLSSDKLPNPTLIRPFFEKNYDEVIEESFEENAKGKGSSGKMLREEGATLLPFDVFLRTVAKHLRDHTNMYKEDIDIYEDLDEMANFMRQLYQGGLKAEDNAKIDPLPSLAPISTLQQWTDSQFNGTANINWLTYLDKIFSKAGVNITNDTLILSSSADQIYGILNLVRQTDPKVLKNFALLRVFLFMAPDSDEVIRNAFEAYYYAKNYTLYDRWEYCTRKVLDATDSVGLSFAVTHDYEQYFFDINKIAEAANMVKSLKTSFEDGLMELTWIEDDDKASAYRKSENLIFMLGYPDFVENRTEIDKFYENVKICEYDNYGNARYIRAFKQAYLYSVLANQNRSFWDKSTFDTNAYYNRPNNKIVLPISMLNEPFFKTNNTLLDFSRLGSIIGHEITHGFDNTGKDYNEDGLQITWWSQATQDAFEEKTKCFIEQYNQYYIPEIDAYVNGTLSLNENLADNGGIREAFNAFKRLVHMKRVINESEKYTWQQLFFIGYGTSWCSDESESYLRSLVNSAYAPTRYRVIGPLSNMVEFAEAFNCPVGSQMNPENKCVLW